MLFIDILIDIIAPIFILILTGYLFEKRFHFDLDVLSKVLLYLVMPATVITTLTTTSLSAAYIRTTTIFCLAMVAVLFLVSTVVARLLGHHKKMGRAFNHTVMFYNSGNFGFPISDLAFPGLGLAVQAIILAIQNVVNFSFGLFMVSAGQYPVKQALIKTLRIPLMYAIVVAGLIRYYDFVIPDVIWLPIQYLSRALIPMALLALGFQLAKTSIRRGIRTSLPSVVLRLLVSPVLAAGLVILLGIREPLAPILIVSTSFPTAINSVLIAMELNNEPEFVANTVFLSTVCSILTVAVAIYVVKAYGV